MAGKKSDIFHVLFLYRSSAKRHIFIE